MDVHEIESEYAHLTVIDSPEDAHLVFDSVAGECVRMNGWTERGDGYQVAIEQLGEIETVTVPQYIAPSNKYYFVQSASFGEHQ